MDNKNLKTFCENIVNANKQQRLSFFHFADRKTVKYIREIAVNILLNDSFTLSAQEKNYLQRKVHHIKDIASRYTSLYKKREIFVAQHLLVKKLAIITLKHLDTVQT